MKKLFKKISRRFFIDSATKQFINYCQRKWPQARETKKSVILVDLFDLNPVIYGFSYIANHLAASTNSSIAAFHLARSFLTDIGLGERRLEKAYDSFGAKLELSLTKKMFAEYAIEAKKFADETLKAVNTKRDVVDIKLEDLKIGELIYDTYLRAGRFTLDLKDPKLRRLIEEAYVIFYECKKFLKERNVKAVFTSHTVYISHGILVRLAIKMGIPVYVMLDIDTLKIVEINNDTYFHHKYNLYRDEFKNLSPDERDAGRSEARQVLIGRLGGQIDKGIADMILEEGRPGYQGYGPSSKTRLMQETGRPRVVVMLPCFFDAPHCYRHMLFPDFWEWIGFLLERAQKTDFDWYVKPHPGGLPENDDVLERLKAKFPKAYFLRRSDSNKQIVEEGVKSIFTVFGSAAHEFAYQGIPVVNAGDNPHINYDFSFHPSNLGEYEKFIYKASQLSLAIDKAQIEEFFYMHYIYPFKKSKFDTRFIDEKYEYQKLGFRVNDSSVLKAYVESETEKKDLNLKAYLDDYFGDRFKINGVKKNSAGLSLDQIGVSDAITS